MSVNLAGTEGPSLRVAATDIVPPVGAYPDPAGFEVDLARRFGVGTAQVHVTAGADDALERVFRAFVDAGDEVVLTTPTFEMLPRYAGLQGATTVAVPWTDAFPADAIARAVTPRTALVVVVSPNNPTGLVATAAELRAVHDAAPGALLIADLAYVEYADADPTATLLTLPRAVVIRTMSKAWGLAGARVGFALAAPDVITWMRRAGNPYPVATPSLALARATLATAEGDMQAQAEAARASRRGLEARLRDLGVPATASEANFACARPADPQWMWEALAACGVASRLVTSGAGFVRVTAPRDDTEGDVLYRALDTLRAPEALVFDMDGVIADVSGSYREAIIATAASFGVPIDAGDVAAAKRAGNANDDWEVTWSLVCARRPGVPFADVKARFERLYQGTEDDPGLRRHETMIVPLDLLRRLAARYPLTIATGRPRADADAFLRRFGLDDMFGACVAREDGPIKPDPFPPAEAMRRVGATRGWMIGDTPDDIRAARGANLLPLGVIAPGDDGNAMRDALLDAGAARVLSSLSDLEQLLP